MSQTNPQWENEIAKRRTFAIISHPDAGKTTMTEKLLYYGGAIREAGVVKGRKNAKHATSDWMEIEKKRGISVTSSAMDFEYKGHHINILDTPGHQDFSEDTYRTLTAADAAVMIIDVAKGVEAQTIKLFKVCRMRGIPIFTFVNKLDRHGKDPFELLEEIERVLGIRSYPMNWPIGMGSYFSGVYDRMKSRVELYQNNSQHEEISFFPVEGAEDPMIGERVGQELWQQLQDEISLLDVAGDEFDPELIAQGQLTPVFRQCDQQLRRADLPGQLPANGASAFCEKEQYRPDRSVHESVFRLHFQNPGQHEPCPPRPYRLFAHLLRQVRAGHVREARASRQRHQAGPACAVHGARSRNRRGVVRR